MIVILVCSVCSVILLLVGFYLIRECYEDLGSTIMAFGCIGLMAYSYLTFDYASASYKAGILNKEYGTSYSQEEVFYASDVIDTIQKLQRKRVEVIVTGEK